MQVGPGLTRRAFQFGERLFFHGDDRDVVSEAARALEGQEGEPAVTGNQTDASHLVSKGCQ